MQEILFESDGVPLNEIEEKIKKLRVQRQRWLGGFHPDSKIRNLAFNVSGVKIGRTTFVTMGLVVLDDYQGVVSIGERGSIGAYVTLMAATSPNDSVLGQHPELQSAIKTAPITIGNDCWIGTGAIIMPGITIGDKAVIGAGAVVTRNVVPYEIVHGVPARHARALSSQ